jgi:hypothetical protein
MMPNILPGLLKQRAVYWPPGTYDKYGERAYGTPQEVVVRWNPTFEEAVDAQGKTFISSTTVYANQDLKINGYLWLSSKTIKDPEGSGLLEAPATPPTNQLIRSSVEISDVDLQETIYEARI